MNYKTFFKGKRVAVIGLGPHGEMIADIKFLLKAGAQIAFFDVRSEARLLGLTEELRQTGLISFTFGKVPAEEVAAAELILLSPDVSRRSLFLKLATERGVQIEYPETLFLKLAIPFTLVGIMGEAGKSIVAQILYLTLKQAFSNYKDQGLYFIDPESSHGALTHLKKLKNGDVVLVRITEEMASEYSAARVSPSVAVVTSVSENPKKILMLIEHQTLNNFLVASDSSIDALKAQSGFASRAKVLRTREGDESLVIQVAELFKVDAESVKKIFENFTGLKSHRELVKKIGGVEFYNDSASEKPLATLFALKQLSVDKNIILILGGAFTGAQYVELLRNIPQYAKVVILLPGSGSLGIRGALERLEGVKFLQAESLDIAVRLAKDQAKKGDKVLFSPAFKAGGIYVSRRERGEKFVKAVRTL